ncbi:MAG: 16S rRNA (guanine(527)-N(7))-methyltransferase RsmG [Gammaproteobacteria bacterium]|nr:16S rRNA (guanine(527)-N(7))-methyltransferase RsmG [Gammaproteobacteria bacterium]
MKLNITKLIETELIEYRLPYNPQLLENLYTYLLLLQKWGTKINLVGNLNVPFLVRNHFIDCMLAMPYIQALGTVRTLIDVGSGAGLPGIILALADPSLFVHCLEPNHKKAHFMTQVVSLLQLSNVSVHNMPIQQFKLKADLITCRAYAQLVKFINDSRHCLDTHGLWLSYKAKLDAQELCAIETLVKKIEIIDIATHYADKRALVLMTPHNRDH